MLLHYLPRFLAARMACSIGNPINDNKDLLGVERATYRDRRSWIPSFPLLAWAGHWVEAFWVDPCLTFSPHIFHDPARCHHRGTIFGHF